MLLQLMKRQHNEYIAPKYEMSVVETEDILTSSLGFEISKSDTGEGKVQLEFSKLFGNI